MLTISDLVEPINDGLEKTTMKLIRIYMNPANNNIYIEL